MVAHNVLQLQEVGDFEALNSLPPQNLIRSTKLYLTTEPPIFCRCCYSQWFLSSVLANHCQYYVLPSLSCRVVRLSIFYFLKRRRFFLIQFCLSGKGGSSFASFGLCLGLFGLQMCLNLCNGC